MAQDARAPESFTTGYCASGKTNAQQSVRGRVKTTAVWADKEVAFVCSLLRSGFYARRRFFQKRGELLALEIVDPDVAGRNRVDPAMEIYGSLAELQGDGGMRTEMVQLGPDVFLRGLDQTIVAFEIDIVFPHQASSGFRLCHPLPDSWQVVDLFRIQERFHHRA